MAVSAMMSAFRGLGKVGTGWATGGGALAGAIYGGLSSDGSVMGGALAGAMIGGGGYGLARTGMRGMLTYNNLRRAGVAGSQARSMALTAMGRGSKKFIGRTMDRAFNPIRSSMKASKLPTITDSPLPTVASAPIRKSASTIRGTSVRQMRNPFPATQMNIPGLQGSIQDVRAMNRIGKTDFLGSASRSSRNIAAQNRLARIKRMQSARGDTRTLNEIQRGPGVQMGMF
jgi:hypothetical protein